MKVTVVYDMDEEMAEHLMQAVKTRQVMGATGAIIACYQGDALEERDILSGRLEQINNLASEKLKSPQ